MSEACPSCERELILLHENFSGKCVPCMQREMAGGAAKDKGTSKKPKGWPDKCGRCGASWEKIGFDYADGFTCSACGGCDSDE